MSTNGKENGQGTDVQVWDTPRTAKRFSSLRDLSVTYEGHSEEVLTRPPDISTKGMFINTNRVFPEGAVLVVEFHLALTGAKVRSRAEVRYCLAGVGVGVEFIGIGREYVRAIEKELEVRAERTHT